MSTDYLKANLAASIPPLSGQALAANGDKNGDKNAKSLPKSAFSIAVPQLTGAVKGNAQLTSNALEGADSKQYNGEKEGNNSKDKPSTEPPKKDVVTEEKPASKPIKVELTPFTAIRSGDSAIWNDLDVKPFEVPKAPEFGKVDKITLGGDTDIKPFEIPEPPEFKPIKIKDEQGKEIKSDPFQIPEPPKLDFKPIEPIKPEGLAPLQTNLAAIDQLFMFDKEGGFNADKEMEEYRDMITQLYKESQTFQTAVNLANQKGKQITLMRNQNALPSRPEFTLDNTYRVNINENNNSKMYVYDTEKQEASIQQGMSKARSLTHELMNVLGFRDGQAVNDYMGKYNQLAAGKEAGEEFGKAFATGPAVRLTNQVLSESQSYNEQPRAIYKTADTFSKDDENTLVDFLTNLHTQDFEADNQYDLLYLKV